MARLDFLDDSQLVIDEHWRAEVSLERSRLLEESREQNGFFSFYYVLFIDSAEREMALCSEFRTFMENTGPETHQERDTPEQLIPYTK